MKQNRLIFSFARRRGKSLHAHARHLVQELLPKLAIRLPEQGELEMEALFGPVNAVRMEIGFGGGEHLAAQARANPDVGFIGCEPFMNGVAKLLAVIEQEKLTNIRLFTDDARLLCEKMPDSCVSHIDILFPDPWPKLRHHKRRLVSQETLATLRRIQPAGASLLLATDHRDYSAFMLEHLRDSPHYEWQSESADDFRLCPASWTQTRYQRKTQAEGREPVFLRACAIS